MKGGQSSQGPSFRKWYNKVTNPLFSKLVSSYQCMSTMMTTIPVSLVTHEDDSELQISWQHLGNQSVGGRIENMIWILVLYPMSCFHSSLTASSSSCPSPLLYACWRPIIRGSIPVLLYHFPSTFTPLPFHFSFLFYSPISLHLYSSHFFCSCLLFENLYLSHFSLSWQPHPSSIPSFLLPLSSTKQSTKQGKLGLR